MGQIKNIKLHIVTDIKITAHAEMQRRKDGKRSLDDLKRILTSFRIDELQTLLSYCGVNLYPRYRHKHELLARAKDLLVNEGNRRRELATSKILELYNQRFGMVPQSHDPVAANTPSIAAQFGHAQTYVPYSSSKDKDAGAYMDYHKQYPSQQQAPMRSSNAIGGSIPSNSANNARTYEQQQSRGVQPSSSIALPIHPDVKFMPLPFYDIIDVLIKPTSLQPKTLSGPQDSNLVYHLTPYQTQLITNSRSYMDTIVEYAVQVQLRFCLNETSCVQEDLYPTRCKLVVNNKGSRPQLLRIRNLGNPTDRSISRLFAAYPQCSQIKYSFNGFLLTWANVMLQQCSL